MRNPAEKTLKKVSILKSMLLLHFLFNRTETLRKHNHLCCFDRNSQIQNNSRFLCFDGVINIMLVFMTNKVPFFNYLSNILVF